MAGIGLNPRYGWDYPQADATGFGYGLLPAYDGSYLLPPAPPGYAWFDVGSAAAAAAAAAAATAAPPQWSANGQRGPPWGPGAAGVGAEAEAEAEAGYTYLFPPSHCKIHVLSSATPPWLNAGAGAGAQCEKRCFTVPTGITVKELMQQFGCTSPDADRNRLVELTQGGDGTWYKGIELVGSDEKKMDQRIDQIGWNTNRNGVDADFVWLWFVKA